MVLRCSREPQSLALLLLLALLPRPTAAQTCAPGSASSSSSGAAPCAPCVGATAWSFGGSAACASACPPSTAFVSSSQGCIPNSTTNGPVDSIAFAFSGSLAEGVAAFSTASNTLGLSHATDRLGTSGAALILPYGAHLDSSSNVSLPTGNAAVSLSAFILCAPFATPQASVLEWGPPAAASSTLKLSLSVLGSGSASVPGPIAGVCDSRWHHVAVVQGDGSATSTKQYVDGRLFDLSTTTTLAVPASGSSLRVGWNGAPMLQAVFTSVGSWSWVVPAGVTSVSVLVVAGGGGGGGTNDRTAGGGGAGGMICQVYAVVPGQVIPVTVGAGGAGGSGTVTPSTAGSSGGNSVFGTLTAIGGGGGGSGCLCSSTYISHATGLPAYYQAGVSGGSGGGVAHDDAILANGAVTYPAGSGVAGQGHSAGLIGYNSGSSTGTFAGSGGGGAGSTGGNGTAAHGGGNGGAGTLCPLIGSTSFFAGGGGGGAQNAGSSVNPVGWTGGGAGGIGGGGAGCTASSISNACNGFAAKPNTGGGGGGASGRYFVADGSGGSGGSGIVIVSWSAPMGPAAQAAEDLFAGSVSDLRVYSRALAASEVLALSQPPLNYAGVANPTPSASATSYTWTQCAAGYVGSASLAWSKNTATNVWSQAGPGFNCAPSDPFLPLEGACYLLDLGSGSYTYEYTACPFVEITERVWTGSSWDEISFGTYAGSSNAGATQSFVNEAGCASSSVPLISTLNFVCGSQRALTAVVESQTCHYTLTVTCPEACTHAQAASGFTVSAGAVAAAVIFSLLGLALVLFLMRRRTQEAGKCVPALASLPPVSDGGARESPARGRLVLRVPAAAAPRKIDAEAMSMAASVATADSVPSKSLEGPRLGLPAPAPIEIVFPAPPQALAPVSAGEILELHVRVIEGRGLRRAHALVRNEPFVTLRCRDELTRSAAVRCDDGEGSAVFDFKSMVHALVEDNVAIAVVHHGGLMSGEAVLGDVVFAVCDLIDGLVAERWLVLHHEGQAAGELHVRMQLMHGGERHIDAPPAAAASAATLSAPAASMPVPMPIPMQMQMPMQIPMQGPGYSPYYGAMPPQGYMRPMAPPALLTSPTPVHGMQPLPPDAPQYLAPPHY